MQLPAADGEVRAAAFAPARDPGHQPAGGGVLVLQAPERGRALQQPPHRDAARQAGLAAAPRSSASTRASGGGRMGKKDGKEKYSELLHMTLIKNLV